LRFSQLYVRTLRAAPSDIANPARQLAIRAGLMRQTDAHTRVFLPLALRVFHKLDAFARASLADFQELACSVVPTSVGPALASDLQSYKQLPARLLIPGACSLYALAFDSAPHPAHFQNLARDLLTRAEIVIEMLEDGENAWAFAARDAWGDDAWLACATGDYAATETAARVLKPKADEAILLLEKVETPHCPTIDALAEFLQVPTSRTAKAVFYSSGSTLIFAIIRGDLQINEAKLKRALGVGELRFATDDEIRRVGATPGYASPVGVKGATIVVDESVVNSPNLVAGANEEGYHLKNTNVPRDYKPNIVTDIALAREGDPCPKCGQPLTRASATILARVSTRALAQTYLDPNGKPKPVNFSSLELDYEKILLTAIAQHHDDKGIIFPSALAPFDVHLVVLNADKPQVASALTRVEQILSERGKDALIDDRAESAGVKFNDADLIGIPTRLTLAPRTVAQNSVELKARAESEARLIEIESLISNL
jgi:prolyl-tRNA synthetase